MSAKPPMSRATAKYIALLALTMIVFHWKTVLTDQFTSIVGFEGVNQTYAWLHFWVRSVWSGHMPLWDPYVFGGRPFTEEMAGYYPVRLLFALVPLNRNDLISPHFYHEYLAFTRFLAACFMFALLREFQRSRFASFIGACAFSMGGVLGRLPWPQYMESCVWLPAIFLFLLRALRSEQRGRALAQASIGGLCMGMSVLTGGVQFAMIQGIFLAAAVAYYAAVHRKSSGAALTGGLPSRLTAYWPREFSILCVIVLAGLGIGAVQLLPSFEYGHLSIRSISGGWLPTDQKIPYDRLVHGMWPQSIISSIFPVGEVMGGEEPWPHYIGALPLFLAVIGIWKCWGNLWVRFLVVLALITFAYSLGEFSVLFGVLYAVVPFLWMARGAARFVYLISFAFAVLSAFGLDSLLEGAGQIQSWAPVRPFLKWSAILCAAALILPGVFTQVTVGIWTNLSLVLILGSCAWIFRLTLRPLPSSARVLLAAFVIFDLGCFNWLSANKNELVKSGDEYVQMVTLRNAAEFVKMQPGLHRARVSIPSEPNIGDFYETPSMFGGAATALTDYSRMSPHEDLLNVRYRIKPVSTPEPGAIYQDSLWKVYEDKTAYPRAWMTHRTILEPSHDAAFRRLDTPGVDLHNVTIVEAPLPSALYTSTTADTVRFTSYNADDLSLDVNAGATGLLVLSEIWYPGWRATVNGKSAEIRRVDGAFRGILVPAGKSHVELAYVPFTFYAGAGISGLTSLGVLAIWLVYRRKSPAETVPGME